MSKLKTTLTTAGASIVKDHIKEQFDKRMGDMSTEGAALMKIAQGNLKKQIGRVRSIVGGETLGCQWGGLKNDADWESIIEHANRHLMKIEPKAVEAVGAELTTATMVNPSEFQSSPREGGGGGSP